MSYTDVVYGIGDLATASYAGLRMLGAVPYGWFNWLLISIGVGMMIWWLGRMVKYDQEAEQNGTLK
ncbi:MAG: hypothetical protein JKY53_04685 [Flavobacteriales bacterium]|nr:hypothetical protein [Flavobacteriales bacterium]